MTGVCAVAERGASAESPTRTTIVRQKIGRKDRKGEREHAFGGVGETRVESRGKSRRGKGKKPNDTCRLDRRSSEACKPDDDSRVGIVTENANHLSVKSFLATCCGVTPHHVAHSLNGERDTPSTHVFLVARMHERSCRRFIGVRRYRRLG